LYAASDDVQNGGGGRAGGVAAAVAAVADRRTRYADPLSGGVSGGVTAGGRRGAGRGGNLAAGGTARAGPGCLVVSGWREYGAAVVATPVRRFIVARVVSLPVPYLDLSAEKNVERGCAAFETLGVFFLSYVGI
jgi:hypothetical protein